VKNSVYENVVDSMMMVHKEAPGKFASTIRVCLSAAVLICVPSCTPCGIVQTDIGSYKWAYLLWIFRHAFFHHPFRLDYYL